MVLDAGRIKHLADLMHKSIASNGTAIASNWRLSADGLMNTVWSPESAGSVSYGSNSNDVGYTDAAGASSLVSRADHVHRGVTSLAHSSNTYTGPVTLETEGSLYIVRSAANTYRFGATGTSGGGGGSSDAITGQIGGGGAAITGLQGSTDIRVAGGSDDEFDTTDTSDPMTGWTTLGSPTHDINSTRKGHYYLSSSAASVALQGIYKAATPAFTVTGKLNDYTITTNTAMRAGLIIAEAAPGKLASIGMSNNGILLISNWTSRTVFSSNPGSFTLGYTPTYLRIVVHSSTNVDYQASVDGKVWSSILAAQNPGFTVGAAGLFINPLGSLTEAMFDWVRFV
jgi:hypothetical protein